MKHNKSKWSKVSIINAVTLWNVSTPQPFLAVELSMLSVRTACSNSLNICGQASVPTSAYSQPFVNAQACLWKKLWNMSVHACGVQGYLGLFRNISGPHYAFTEWKCSSDSYMVMRAFFSPLLIFQLNYRGTDLGDSLFTSKIELNKSVFRAYFNLMS